MAEWVKPFVDGEQEAVLGDHVWNIPRLWKLTEGFKIMEIPLAHINMYYVYKKLTLRELAGHCVAIRDADMSYPIILDEDGEIMDGRHRLLRAIVGGHETIKAVRFRNNPAPCRVKSGKN